MRHRKDRRGGSVPPPFTDPAFAEALARSSSKNHSPRNRHRYHKSRQLCRQVQRALNLALADCGDERLRELYVTEVNCPPGSAHLLVRIVVPASASAIDVLAHIDAVSPRLRAEVAQAITRKRTPELSFIPVLADREVQP